MKVQPKASASQGPSVTDEEIATLTAEALKSKGKATLKDACQRRGEPASNASAIELAHRLKFWYASKRKQVREKRGRAEYTANRRTF